MDETKGPESSYSGDRTEITGPHSLRGTTATAEPANPEKAAASTETAQVPATTKPTPKISVAASPRNTSLAGVSPVETRPGGYSPFADFIEYLKRTKYVWLSLAGAAIVFMAMVTALRGMAERARIAQEKRHETAATAVTPENLIARCGPAAEDVTKEMYPMVLRIMSYQPRENEKLVFEFSRTAEAKSDWVFLSIKDSSGAKSYDTPEAKIAALPCLDSKK